VEAVSRRGAEVAKEDEEKHKQEPRRRLQAMKPRLSKSYGRTISREGAENAKKREEKPKGRPMQWHAESAGGKDVRFMTGSPAVDPLVSWREKGLRLEGE